MYERLTEYEWVQYKGNIPIDTCPQGFVVRADIKLVRIKYWPSTSEYKGNTGQYLPKRQSHEARYRHSIARRMDEYKVGASIIVYTSVAFF